MADQSRVANVTAATDVMDGLMQPRPLTIAHILERAERLYAHKPITTAHSTNAHATTAHSTEVERVSYADVAGNVRRLATVLDGLGVPVGARVGTFASNSRRHLELYLAVPATKRVLHSINIRLSAEHLEYIVNHAEDDVIFLDRGLLPRIWPKGCPVVAGTRDR